MINKEAIPFIYNKMLEDIYQEIKELDSTDPCSISEAVCKFTEESGEWIISKVKDDIEHSKYYYDKDRNK